MPHQFLSRPRRERRQTRILPAGQTLYGTANGYILARGLRLRLQATNVVG